MRELIFRGKRKLDGAWIYGGYMKTQRTNKVQVGGTSKFCTVIPETLGEYTGRKDKNGTKIFEGDVFGDSSRQEIDVVVFENGCFQLKSYYFAECCLDGNAYEEKWGNWNIEPLCNFNLENDEILGNIYDNPELLEVSNE